MPGEDDVLLVVFMYRVCTRMPVEDDVPLVEFMYVYLLACQVERKYLWWSLCTCMYSHAEWRGSTSGRVYVRVFTRMPSGEDVPLVEFMYRVCTRMPNGEDVPLVECMLWRLRTLYFLALHKRDLNSRSLA